jgi:AcrR family transcriptional regulator
VRIAYGRDMSGEAPVEAKRRAPGMSAPERRAMIVESAVPLVVEYGAAVTTLQIAKAAGIGEATVFRAFADKDELLAAVVAEVLDPEHVAREIAAIPMNQSLRERLIQAANALRAHFERMGAVLGALSSSGQLRRPAKHAGPGRRGPHFFASRNAMTQLFEPERKLLRLSPEQCAELFTNLLIMRTRTAEHLTTTGDVVELFLHGAIR